ncbi:hypothetical protein GDO81_003745 [Engystomops pustulosus]|uniref:Uncharacterized protein n=1 Tax=Engystomops pustulosus TaxID=76066 RepID=A0AAV6ZY71_ENGPU|nr:hypothetical protein GDO81_003745 [Engystomops pustulosus]
MVYLILKYLIIVKHDIVIGGVAPQRILRIQYVNMDLSVYIICGANSGYSLCGNLLQVSGSPRHNFSWKPKNGKSATMHGMWLGLSLSKDMPS